ncbi:MAG: DUF4384 domain-containing protein [Nitrospirota bacterium]
MKSPIPLIVLMFLVLFTPAYAAQSTITEADGNACMGDDKSRKQTEQAALADAKKRAVEFASTYIKSETHVKNFELEKDLLSAYANAEVKIIQELDKSWYKDPSSGDCCKIKIKAEIIPDVKAMETLSRDTRFSDDPSAPLKVKAWTDKKEYKTGEKIKVYIRGNKPFYARVLYKDASGETLQLLPNPYRAENYFNGGSVYEIPAGNDKFDLEVSPPFGEENVIVYASSSPLGEISTEAQGGVYQVKTQTRDIGMKTRGIKLAEKTDSKNASAAASEFFEDKVVVKTGR